MRGELQVAAMQLLPCRTCRVAFDVPGGRTDRALESRWACGRGEGVMHHGKTAGCWQPSM